MINHPLRVISIHNCKAVFPLCQCHVYPSSRERRAESKERKAKSVEQEQRAQRLGFYSTRSSLYALRSLLSALRSPLSALCSLLSALRSLLFALSPLLLKKSSDYIHRDGGVLRVCVCADSVGIFLCNWRSADHDLRPVSDTGFHYGVDSLLH